MSIINQTKTYTGKSSCTLSNIGGAVQTIPAFVQTTINLPNNETPTSTELYTFTTANRIIIKRAGWYRVTFYYILIGSSLNRYFTINKTLVPYTSMLFHDNLDPAVNAYSSGTASSVLFCAVGSQIYVTCYTNTSCDMGFGADYTKPKLHMQFLGDSVPGFY